jgi:long-subunit fatty acid transport protein
MVRTSDFDKTFRFMHLDRHDIEGDLIAVGSEFQSGGLYQWSAGFGIDLSPRISFGASLSMYTGKHDYDFEYGLDSCDVLTFQSEQLIEDRYLGFGAKVGLAVQLTPEIGIGIAAESPVTLKVDEDVHEYYSGWDDVEGSYNGEDAYPVEYDVKRPFVFSGGFMFQSGLISIAGDIDYTDWSQLSYGDNIYMEEENDNIKEYYRDVLRSRIGAEVVIPSYGLSLRAGLFSDPLPYVDEFQNDFRQGYTFGLGFLVDQVMTIDLAYVHGSYGRNSDLLYGYTDTDLEHYLVVDEDITYNRIFMTAAYRF